MSYSNKKGKKHDFITRAIETYINYNSKYDLDSSELETFNKFVCFRLRFITKEELLNAENKINELIYDFIIQYCISVLFCLSLSLSLHL